MIALPHLLFLTVMGLFAWIAWALDVAAWDDATAVSATVVMGLGTGLLIGAWT